VYVLGLPHLDALAERGQQVVVIRRRLLDNRVDGGPHAHAPALVERDVAHALIERRLEVGGHLYRQRATLRHLPEQARHQLAVPLHPLQRGIRVNQIVRTLRAPVANVALDPGLAWIRRARLGQHLGGVIHAREFGVGPAGLQHGCRIAGAATQVHDPAWVGKLQARDQIDGRLRALLAKPQI
jgi:hypothetical protein